MHAAPRDAQRALRGRGLRFLSPRVTYQGPKRITASLCASRRPIPALITCAALTSRSPHSCGGGGGGSGVVYRRRRNSEGEDEWVGHGQSQKQEEESARASATREPRERYPMLGQARSAAVRPERRALLSTRCFTVFLFRFNGRLLDSCEIFMVEHRECSV